MQFVGDLGNGRDRRRNAHVNGHVRKVRDGSVPSIVVAHKVELLAAEARHVRVTLQGRGWGSRRVKDRVHGK